MLRLGCKGENGKSVLLIITFNSPVLLVNIRADEYIYDNEIGYIIEDYITNKYMGKFEEHGVEYDVNVEEKIMRAKHVADISVSRLYSLSYDLGKDYVINLLNERFTEVD